MAFFLGRGVGAGEKGFGSRAEPDAARMAGAAQRAMGWDCGEGGVDGIDLGLMRGVANWRKRREKRKKKY